MGYALITVLCISACKVKVVVAEAKIHRMSKCSTPPVVWLSTSTVLVRQHLLLCTPYHSVSPVSKTKQPKTSGLSQFKCNILHLISEQL